MSHPFGPPWWRDMTEAQHKAVLGVVDSLKGLSAEQRGIEREEEAPRE